MSRVFLMCRPRGGFWSKENDYSISGDKIVVHRLVELIGIGTIVSVIENTDFNMARMESEMLAQSNRAENTIPYMISTDIMMLVLHPSSTRISHCTHLPLTLSSHTQSPP